MRRGGAKPAGSAELPRERAAATTSMVRTMRVFYRLMGNASPGARLIERDGLTAAVVPATPERSVMNSVVYEETSELIGSLEELAAAYAEAGVTAWTVWTPAEDHEAKRALAAAGHMLDAEPEGMVRPLDGVEAPAGFEDWTADGAVADVTAINDSAYPFEPPEPFARALPSIDGEGLRSYVARADGSPASCVITLDHDGDCGIFAVATRPEARGRGLSGRLLQQALADARERGCTTTSLQATRMGRPVYERLGYRGLGPVEMWERRA